MKRLAGILLAASLVCGCSQNKLTGKSQFSLVSDTEMRTMADQQYKEFLSKNSVVRSGQQAEMVKRVSQRVANAVVKYYSDKGLSQEVSGFQWEYNLVDSKEVNAWCMPGGKIVVYTGILPVTQNEAALAVVIGHEVAHAIAEHSKERMSNEMAAQFGSQVLANVLATNPTQAQNIFLLASGVSTLGVTLPHSRKQELEADKLGLIYCAVAGYDPQEAIPFWKRMGNLSAGGSKPPEFLSTHPAEGTRIKQLEDMMPEALTYYNKTSKN